MTAISAASVRCSTLMDGTLRVVFDVEPNDADAAFALFGKPGRPAALAALVTGYAAKSDEPMQASRGCGPLDKPKGGPLSKEAALLCQNPAFREWYAGHLGYLAELSEPDAAAFMRNECCVESRAEFDTDDGAKARFINNIRIPFMRERATA